MVFKRAVGTADLGLALPFSRARALSQSCVARKHSLFCRCRFLV